MSYDFFKCCDKLLKVLPSEAIMEPYKVSEYLNVTESYAMTVIERLRKDGLADGFGNGPVSRNKRTAVFPDFYKEEIEKLKDYRRTRLYARWGFGIAVTSILLQIAQFVIKSIWDLIL